jgi:hypothetical protein
MGAGAIVATLAGETLGLAITGGANMGFATVGQVCKVKNAKEQVALGTDGLVCAAMVA